MAECVHVCTRALREEMQSGGVTLREDQALEDVAATSRKARAFRNNVMLYKLRTFTDDPNEESGRSAKLLREASVRSKARSMRAKREAPA